MSQLPITFSPFSPGIAYCFTTFGEQLVENCPLPLLQSVRRGFTTAFISFDQLRHVLVQHDRRMGPSARSGWRFDRSYSDSAKAIRGYLDNLDPYKITEAFPGRSDPGSWRRGDKKSSSHGAFHILTCYTSDGLHKAKVVDVADRLYLSVTVEGAISDSGQRRSKTSSHPSALSHVRLFSSSTHTPLYSLVPFLPRRNISRPIIASPRQAGWRRN